ncbi:ATP-binding protein [Crossiella sp. CA-258035]|uniref:sensor histidine kinase n=1 Tax=Crossiella sp. CA-258035 TaxID=2981138 RepID=UPI0024BD0C51|nr:ATP-binding protein [Crossiella sp. CA-258035]WHT20600.1 ATP-binding protein [Crossiella sp. CA-258035]
MSPRWHGSLRFRLLMLTAVVAVLSAGLTAWLTVYQASQQVSSEAAAEQAVSKSIVDELVGYGAVRGKWDGVAGTVRALRDRTGQRIRLTTMAGQVVVDSDTLDGGPARPLGNRTPLLIDPVPTPVPPPEAFSGSISLPTLTTFRTVPPASTQSIPFTTGTTSAQGYTTAPTQTWLSRLLNYRKDVELASCLIDKGFAVEQQAKPDGIPVVDLIGPDPDQGRKQALAECAGKFRAAEMVRAEGAAYEACKVNPGGSTEQCVLSRFRSKVQEIMPAPLLLSMGAGEPLSARTVPLLPALLAAAGVALVAILGMWLVSRRVLRPVGALMTASTRLGAGDLAERVPVRGHDEIADLAGAFNRMADSLQRSEERQRRMIADIAHELRTPLANIRGYLEALKDGVLPPDPDLFDSLHEEALLQQRLIEDIQLLALADAGSLSYQHEPVDLGEVVAATRTGFQAVATAAGVDLVSTVDDPAPVVTGDPNRLRQVLGNLVSNAIRATPAGGVVELAARAEGGMAVLTVTDTGRGIRAADLPHVFDRFWRADDARTRATGGSGLGLSIAREIVTAHGGAIAAESPAVEGAGGAVGAAGGSGSRFSVRLPLLTGTAGGTGSPGTAPTTPPR